ncbi:hypothetical protein [Dyella caseinilytica]|uniref:Uncharacterized protein n=1 Tax=Dyella caseinilytica TaxID=1849581 RepID=A0ABX7GSU5_9GAMM|nr:hypothetical protein [Dyella caseinilytica]QRN53512.1 hypothetical protein ISN74_19215 [Dyella caseinilytica]GFZ87014.1 hypothetical protein GCM10011408_02020 [Dyella caseinilytica]
MFKACMKHNMVAAGLFLAISAQLPALAAAQTTAPDSGLYTTYSFDAGYTNAYLSICGSTEESEGCYGGATLGPFGQAGALIEGHPSIDTTTGTVTRHIYVIDEAANGGTGVALYDYIKTDTVSASFDSVKVSLNSTVALPLTGGSGAQTYLAADNDYLFIGTNQSSFALKVQKSDLSFTQVGGFYPPVNVSSITSDAYGYVTVTFGGITGSNGFYVFAPNGSSDEDGGGADFMVSNSNGLTTANLATTGASPASRMQVHFKKLVSVDNTGK